VIGLITEWVNENGEIETRNADSNLGGTMRLGAQQCHLQTSTKARAIYGQDTIVERHRHRYEVNNQYVERLTQAGLIVSGRSADNSLVEMVEIADHPWFVACQFHPEFTSSPRGGHPLFSSFIAAAMQAKK
ncbi:MAG TPA: gamma-glutamyl-gamma-aminobutyrate hydrolase family protein, partial [Agitococcus sp.]|nr:gamma-glutamyl-gamma-aminobutyrate hydrolase family protein [Agitococcus sp.]HNC02046.1 gamma-glutamyl-gamma-aminobutyrate hydrolase family protein [Agitococcus sp.]